MHDVPTDKGLISVGNWCHQLFCWWLVVMLASLSATVLPFLKMCDTMTLISKVSEIARRHLFGASKGSPILFLKRLTTYRESDSIHQFFQLNPLAFSIAKINLESSTLNACPAPINQEKQPFEKRLHVQKIPPQPQKRRAPSVEPSMLHLIQPWVSFNFHDLVISGRNMGNPKFIGNQQIFQTVRHAPNL